MPPACGRYSTFEQDVDVVVEDLQERMEHMKELSRNAEKFANFNEKLAIPEVLIRYAFFWTCLLMLMSSTVSIRFTAAAQSCWQCALLSAALVWEVLCTACTYPILSLLSAVSRLRDGCISGLCSSPAFLGLVSLPNAKLSGSCMGCCTGDCGRGGDFARSSRCALMDAGGLYYSGRRKEGGGEPSCRLDIVS